MNTLQLQQLAVDFNTSEYRYLADSALFGIIGGASVVFGLPVFVPAIVFGLALLQLVRFGLSLMTLVV